MKILISKNITVHIQGRRLPLRKPKMIRVLNANLIVPKWQNICVISNMKYTAVYTKIWPSDTFLEPDQTSKIDSFFKNS